MSAEILVLAGTNGAGKSSIAGEALLQAGAACYNPDEAARRYVAAGVPLEAADGQAWEQDRTLLERAIRGNSSFAFETTLGGRTITELLLDAAKSGIRVRVWYVGLASPELHIHRVHERVARGGHDIPGQKIRDRWNSSRQNLIRLLSHLAEIAVWDNSIPAAPRDIVKCCGPGLIRRLPSAGFDPAVSPALRPGMGHRLGRAGADAFHRASSSAARPCRAA
jgi:predicted ABC-type ATPase